MNFLSFISFFLFYGASMSMSFDVTHYKLKNGMEVLLYPDSSVPLIAFFQYYKVGSKHEKKNHTGLAHFFEHMMFKGTKKYSREDFENIIKEKGGTNNAFTSYDVTAYYENFLSENKSLDQILDLESDRMKNLALVKKDIDLEREVVKSEKRLRYDDSPRGSLYLKTMESLFKGSPYEHSVIGSLKDLNNTTYKEFREFYETYYNPNNSVLVLSGDFKITNAKKLIEKYYGKIKKREIPKFKKFTLLEQKKKRQTVLRKKIQYPMLTLSYPSVDINHEDVYALHILSSLLTDGKTSYLYKKVYEKNLASVSSYQSSMMEAGAFMFDIQMLQKEKINEVLSIIKKQIKEFQTKKISEKELRKAKNNYLVDYLDSFKGVLSKARLLAYAHMYYGKNFRKVFDEIKKYEKVTSKDINRVAKKYFKNSKENIVKILPL